MLRVGGAVMSCRGASVSASAVRRHRTHHHRQRHHRAAVGVTGIARRLNADVDARAMTTTTTTTRARGGDGDGGGRSTDAKILDAIDASSSTSRRRDDRRTTTRVGPHHSQFERDDGRGGEILSV